MESGKTSLRRWYWNKDLKLVKEPVGWMSESVPCWRNVQSPWGWSRSGLFRRKHDWVLGRERNRMHGLRNYEGQVLWGLNGLCKHFGFYLGKTGNDWNILSRVRYNTTWDFLKDPFVMSRKPGDHSVAWTRGLQCSGWGIVFDLRVIFSHWRSLITEWCGICVATRWKKDWRVETRSWISF